MKYTADLKNFIRKCATQLRSDLKTVHLDRYTYFLIGLFIILFGYSIFTMNDIGISPLGAIGVDHASMLDSMIKILEPRTLYNQTAPYHSSYYGWTYFCLSFIFLLPVKFIAWLCGTDPYLPVFIGLKTLHLIYAVLCCVSFYYLARKFFTLSQSFIIALIFAVGTALTNYTYLFHPEVIGLLFLNLSCIYLFNLTKKDTPRIRMDYWIILFFLVLSTLSKPTFFIVTFPVYLCLLVVYLQKSGHLSLDHLRSKDFIKFIAQSTAFAIGIFFVINPFFFIKFQKAINRQLENIAIMKDSDLGIASLNDAINTWITIILQEPLLVFGMISAVLLTIYFLFNRKTEYRYIYAFIFGAVTFDILFVIANFHLFISTSYFIPMLPLLLLGAMATSGFVFKKMFRNLMICTLLSSLLMLGLAYPKIQNNIAELKDFYSYQDKTAYKIYAYIQQNIPGHSSILHDHLVGIPEGKDLKSFHYWQHPLDLLKDIQTDYIIFDPEMKFNDKYQDQTIILRDRTKSGDYKKIETIDNMEIWQRKKNS